MTIIRLIKKKLSINYALKIILSTVVEVINIFVEVVGSVFGDKKIEQSFKFLIGDHKKPLIEATEKKKNATVIKTQIMIMSESESKIRATNSAYSMPGI